MTELACEFRSSLMPMMLHLLYCIAFQILGKLYLLGYPWLDFELIASMLDTQMPIEPLCLLEKPLFIGDSIKTGWLEHNNPFPCANFNLKSRQINRKEKALVYALHVSEPCKKPGLFSLYLFCSLKLPLLKWIFIPYFTKHKRLCGFKYRHTNGIHISILSPHAACMPNCLLKLIRWSDQGISWQSAIARLKPSLV